MHACVQGLKHRQYSTASDVWSYGMLLFEIWTLGCKPYEGTSTDEVFNIFYCLPDQIICTCVVVYRSNVLLINFYRVGAYVGHG